MTGLGSEQTEEQTARMRHISIRTVDLNILLEAKNSARLSGSTGMGPGTGDVQRGPWTQNLLHPRCLPSCQIQISDVSLSSARVRREHSSETNSRHHYSYYSMCARDSIP